LKKIVKIFPFLASTMLIIPTMASAVYTNGDAFFSGGLSEADIASLDYWESSSVASNGYDYYTANARSDYANISYANIGFSRQTSSTYAELRFYAGSYGSDYYGIMDPYVLDSYDNWDPASPDEEWDMVKVKLNHANMESDNLSSANRHEVTLHELGHALGLVHQEDGTNSVMEETDLDGRRDPTSLDIANLQWRY